MTRKSSAVWTGGLKSGQGYVSTESGALRDVPYAFNNRFEDTPGSNPEELVAAAHAGCFAMAFSADLEKAGFAPERVEASAAVTLEFVDGKPTVTKSHLTVRARVPSAPRETVEEIGQGAKNGCPISRLLNAEITMDLATE
jgi:osmotically inducible protein OsmC